VFPWPGFDFTGQLISKLGFNAGFLIPLVPMLLVVTFALSTIFACIAIVRKKSSLQFWLQAACCIPLVLFLPAY